MTNPTRQEIVNAYEALSDITYLADTYHPPFPEDSTKLESCAKPSSAPYHRSHAPQWPRSNGTTISITSQKQHTPTTEK